MRPAIVTLLACIAAASVSLPSLAPPSALAQTRPAPGGIPAREPDDVEPVLREAGALLRQGRVEDGIQRLRSLVERHPENWRVVQTLGRTLESLGRTEDAIAVFRDAAERMDTPGPALMELARQYRLDGQSVVALEVCMDVLERVPGGQEWVANEIESMISSDNLGPEAVGFLEKAVRTRSKDVRLREILASAYLHIGRDEDGLRLAMQLESEAKGGSGVLFRFARLAEDKNRDAAALRAFQAVLASDPKPVVAEEIHYRTGQILLRSGRYEEAASALEAASAVAPHGRLGSRAGIEKADILARRLRRCEDALSAYQQVLDQLEAADLSRGRSRRQSDVQRDRRAADEVRLKMAECHLRLGRPAEAAEIFEELADDANDPDTRHAAQFQVGELLFYQGRLQDAEDAWYRLIDEEPRQAWANDALARILMVGEKADEGGVPLTAFAQAQYQMRLGNMERALLVIDEALRDYPASRAADNLLLERSRILLRLGRIEEARVSADTLTARFPESPLGPRALLETADRMVLLPDMQTEAQALYMEVIMRAPDSLEAIRAREAFRRLREKAPETSSLAEPSHRPCSVPLPGAWPMTGRYA